jgi:hypothetical protein
VKRFAFAPMMAASSALLAFACGSALASSLAAINTNEVSGSEGAFFAAANSLEALPYELVIAYDQEGTEAGSRHVTFDNGHENANQWLSSDHAIFRQLNVKPTSVLLSIDSTQYQRELGNSTLLDGTYEVNSNAADGTPVLDQSDFSAAYSSGSVDLIENLDDGGIASLAALSAGEAEQASASIDASAVGSAGGGIGGSSGGSGGGAASAGGGSGATGAGSGAEDGSGRSNQIAARDAEGGVDVGLDPEAISLNAEDGVGGNGGDVSGVPIPAALPLLLSALLGFGAVSRQRRKTPNV